MVKKILKFNLSGIPTFELGFKGWQKKCDLKVNTYTNAQNFYLKSLLF